MTSQSNTDIQVVHEDEHVVVINKPSGLVVHSDGRTEEGTVVDWLLEQYPDIENVGESWTRDDGTTIPRPGIVHRLDRQTSGVLVVAKTQKMFEHLKKQFQERTIEKTYNAFVYGMLKDTAGTIDLPIGKSTKDFRKWSAQRGAKGELREAVTEYKVLQQGTDVAFVEVWPKTGRTHQIRVHLKAIHHSVVCDKLYAPKQVCILGFKRLALHARTLSFMTEDRVRTIVEAPLPLDFTHALNFLK